MRVYTTVSMSSEDMNPSFSFGVYDECDDVVCINMNPASKRKRRLSPQMLDQMSEEEINEWYEYNGTRYGYDD